MFGSNDTQNNQNDFNQPAADTPDDAQGTTITPTAPGVAPSFSAPAAPTAPLDLPAPAPAADSEPPAPADQAEEPAASAPPSDLLALKQDALQQLSPLVGHLEQTPEEKFRTTMMMIQASDDQSLIKAAYEAAKQITDEKARAQALLDVVNEINYFTQQHNS